MRALSIGNLLEKKYKVFKLVGIWLKAMGTPERNGVWIVYGREKNGKTWFALLLAKLLAAFEKVWYISGEEGTAMTFQEAVKRAKLCAKKDNIKFFEYMPFDDIRKKLNSGKAARVVVIDNTLVYGDEIKKSDLKKLQSDHPNILFIFLSHEDKGEPSNALGRDCKKWAKVIFRIEGLSAHISGRVPGGTVTVDEEKAMIYWGTKDISTH